MTTTTTRPTFQDRLFENQTKIAMKRERKALSRTHGLAKVVTINIIGNRQMTRQLERGWSILSHSPSNYAHTNHYVMVKLRDLVILDLQAHGMVK